MSAAELEHDTERLTVRHQRGRVFRVAGDGLATVTVGVSDLGDVVVTLDTTAAHVLAHLLAQAPVIDPTADHELWDTVVVDLLASSALAGGRVASTTSVSGYIAPRGRRR